MRKCDLQVQHDELISKDPNHTKHNYIGEEELTYLYFSIYAPSLSEMDEILGRKSYATTYINNKQIVVFEDDGSIENFELQIRVPYNIDRENHSQYQISKKYSKYKVEIYRLSDYCYRKLNPKTSSFAGIYSPFSSLFNTSGGYGILGCMSKIESDWLYNLAEPQTSGM